MPFANWGDPIRPDFLLDTNILVHWVRGGPLGRSIVARYRLGDSSVRCGISTVVRGEIVTLSHLWDWGASFQQRLDDVLSVLNVFDISMTNVLDTYSLLDYYSRRACGRRMGKNDLWIAATAVALDVPLLTADHDFDHLHPNHLTVLFVDPAVP